MSSIQAGSSEKKQSFCGGAELQLQKTNRNITLNMLSIADNVTFFTSIPALAKSNNITTIIIFLFKNGKIRGNGEFGLFF